MYQFFLPGQIPSLALRPFHLKKEQFHTAMIFRRIAINHFHWEILAKKSLRYFSHMEQDTNYMYSRNQERNKVLLDCTYCALDVTFKMTLWTLQSTAFLFCNSVSGFLLREPFGPASQAEIRTWEHLDLMPVWSETEKFLASVLGRLSWITAAPTVSW